MAQWKFPVFGHGGDYNPDQWRHIPGTLDEDVRLMKLAHCNLMSVGIFSWAALEPEEGNYDFEWLKEVLDRLHASGISVFLATPTGARPAWMSHRYPEVLRVDASRQRNLHGGRHNHCYSSPVYRDFTHRMNTALAQRFGHHPAVVGWHVSNEYGGECYCDLCQAAFRDWLQAKYRTLEALNQAWWTGFWAKTYTDWCQLEAPVPSGEMSVHGLTLDWKRFVTDQTVDFMRAEIAPLRHLTPNLPVTTNMMGAYDGLDYFRFEDVIDVASYDCYPHWGVGDDEDNALDAAFQFDLTRSIKRSPWLLMESTPSLTNWAEVCKLKRPGMHLLSSMLAVAHGADTVQYFQWRKSRGACEKFHGAVVDHAGHENTRVFKDVVEVGQWLEKLTPVLGARVEALAAVIFDWNNRWAIDSAQGPRRDKQHYNIVQEHYKALVRQGMAVDVVDSEKSLDGYRLVVAPMLYMIKPGVAERLTRFVERGGTLVTTFWSGIVDENDLCFTGGFPGPLRKLLGVWSEEIDALAGGDTNEMIMAQGNDIGLSGTYECGFLCDLIHAESASVVATYGQDFYAGRPALTVNAVGKGKAWYLASRTGGHFLQEFYRNLMLSTGICPVVNRLPDGMHVTERVKDGRRYLFVMNFTGKSTKVTLPVGRDLITGSPVGGETVFPPLKVLIVERT